MIRSSLVLVFAAALVLLLAPAAGATPGDVLGSVPTPATAPTGLTWDGHQLWLADQLTDQLYAIDPASGEVLRRLPAPGFVPRGLAWDGKLLWCIDGEENRILALDVGSGITVHSLEAPTAGPEGLAWDGRYLWLSDPLEDVICQISTEDGTTIKRFTAPMTVATGLTFWQGYLWSADRREDRIYLMDPAHDGEVVLSLAAPGPCARGLASDGKTLWCADYQNDRIDQLVLEDDQPFRISDQHRLHLLLTHEFRNYGPGQLLTLDVYIAQPRDLPNQKLLGAPVLDPPPKDVLKDRWQQPVAHYAFTDLPLAHRQQVRMTADVELAAVRHFVYPHRVGALKDIPKDVRQAYLVDEDKYRITDPIIVKAVKEAVGDETNPYWMMRRIHRYIRERLHYELSGGWNVAPRVLERGSGSCSEYTFLFIAMCRAAGIPARYVGSVVIRGDEASTDDVFHRWSQVYLPGYGWVHVDPQGGDRERPGEVAESIGVLSNRFLITTEGGGASEYLGWNYNYEQTWTSRGPVKVHAEAAGEWSPLSEEQP
jgi:hypothetical protein